MYGRMTGMASKKGGAGRAWTKRAVAQKGHVRHARGLIHKLSTPVYPEQMDVVGWVIII